jgi:hypothetical protein
MIVGHATIPTYRGRIAFYRDWKPKAKHIQGPQQTKILSFLQFSMERRRFGRASPESLKILNIVVHP